VLTRSRDPKREAELQAAFEEAERHRAERRAGALFDNFIDASPVGIELFDARGNPVKSNKAAERLLGKIPPPGIPLTDPRGLRRAGLLEPQLKRVLAGTRVETPPTWYDPTEIGLPGIPGTKVCFRATVFPLFDHEGTVTRIGVLYEDLTEVKKLEQTAKEAEDRLRAAPPREVTEAPVSGPAVDVDARDIEFQRRKLESALRESEERYRSFVESARGTVIVRFSEDGHIVALSPSVETFWGIRRDTILLDNAAWFSRIHPEDLDRVKKTEAEARRSGTYPDDYQFRVVNMTSNAVFWLEARGAACSWAGRRTLDAVIVDITARKNLESELADRERKLAPLLVSPGDGVFVLDVDWVVKSWSPAAEKETRVNASEALGRRLWEIYPDLEKSGFAAPFKKALTEKKPQFFEGFYQDGREKYAGWFHVSVYPYGAGTLAIIRNVSARRRAELAWQEADSKLKTLLDQPGVAFALKDRNLRYLLANPVAARTVFSGAGGNAVGKTDPELFNARVSALLTSHDRKVLDSGTPVELELALPDGSAPNPTWYHITKHPWRSASGEVAGVLDICYDITQRVRAQQELTRRREAFDRLLAEQSQILKKAQEELGRWTG
jgi:PAS domain S-box-containing protein